MTILVARHAETTKNLLQAHGRSAACEITAGGSHEIDRLIAIARRYGTSCVSYAGTPQAELTAQLLVARSQLKLGRCISLAPYNLGRVAGLTERQLVDAYPDASRSLENFRYRLASLDELQLPDGEDPKDLCERLREWANFELPELDGQIVIGSSSVITMFGNLCSGDGLEPRRYYNFPAATGSVRAFELTKDGRVISTLEHPTPMWPRTTYATDLAGSRGTAITVHNPAWELKDSLAIFIPGYFGNSRSGPYGLYSDLARKLAYRGVESWTVDLPGSGDGAPVRRDWSRDTEAVGNVLECATQRRSTIVVVGHSMSAALAARAGAGNPHVHSVALAPLVRWDQLAYGLFSSEQVRELKSVGWINRRGIDLRADYVTCAESAWDSHMDQLAMVILGGADTYAPIGSMAYPERRSVIVAKGDHNFTSAESAGELLTAILTLV